MASKRAHKSTDPELEELPDVSSAGPDEDGESIGELEIEKRARHRNFGSALRVDEVEPLMFDMCDQTFHCRPAMTSRRLLRFVKQADGAQGGEAGDALYSFMDSALVPEDVQRWNDLLDSEDYIIDVAFIGEIISWLVEVYSSRPTKRFSPSPSGPQTTSPG
jgi:hypothetical protein